MGDACSFTGTKNNISDYTLGAHKRVAADVVVVKDGKKHTEDIRSASWRIGTADGGAVKDYQITRGKGEAVPLSPEDLGQNPVSFKLWKSDSESKSIRCSGTSSQGPITASGSMSVNKQLTGTFKRSCFYGPVIKQGYELVFPSFSRRLVSSFDLKLEKTSNGTLGVIHLVKSKVIQIDSSNQETMIVDTGNEFVLYTPQKGVQDPVQNQVRVANGVLQGAGGSAYGFDLEILQTIENDYSYRFEEEYRSYLFFKGNGAGDIWHPVGFESDRSSSPVYMRCQYASFVSYSEKDDLWHFPDYTPTSPSFSKADQLPEWNQDIHDCVRKEIIVLKKEWKPIATEQNVHALIGLLGLAPDAPEMTLPATEKVALVNHFLRSTYGGWVAFPLNYAFANAIGTSNDPHNIPGWKGASWLELWRATENGGNAAAHCTSEGFQVGLVNPCQPGFVGGHVVDGAVAYAPLPGSNAVYIFPICKQHNGNDNVHMQATHYWRGVWLNNFFQ